MEVKHILYEGVFTRYLRFLPKTQQGAVCLRTELFGVKLNPGEYIFIISVSVLLWEMRWPNSLHVLHCAVLNTTVTRSFSAFKPGMHCTNLYRLSEPLKTWKFIEFKNIIFQV